MTGKSRINVAATNVEDLAVSGIPKRRRHVVVGVGRKRGVGGESRGCGWGVACFVAERVRVSVRVICV